MDEYLLFLVFERQPQLGDSCSVLKVLLLLLEEVGTWTISLLLLSSSIGASTNISSIQSSQLKALRLQLIHPCRLSLLLVQVSRQFAFLL